jgi:hypothetical protein
MDMERFRLRRVDLRDQIEEDYGDGGDTHWLGGESRWLANVPNVYEALATPATVHDFIRAPQPGEDHPGGAPAYWASLLHLLIYSFGWINPGIGLRRWIDEGCPVDDDDRLALIKEVWVRDGQFDWFCAWMWTSGFPYAVISDAEEDSRWVDLTPDRDWLTGVDSAIERSGVHAPYGGGTDPLHLSGHVGWLWDADPQGEISLALDPDGAPHGVVISESLAGWYRYLHEAPQLNQPHPSGRSWRIDVATKRAGWLGTYRKSRVTNRWFSGSHSHHMLGVPV